jgi:hypothetical protein
MKVYTNDTLTYGEWKLEPGHEQTEFEKVTEQRDRLLKVCKDAIDLYEDYKSPLGMLKDVVAEVEAQILKET